MSVVDAVADSGMLKRQNFGDLAFTPRVKAVQERLTSLQRFTGEEYQAIAV